MIELRSQDGSRLAAYRAEPSSPARGAVVVIQEIFGVNHHIRAVCDGYAREGYLAIAPSLFDRIEPGLELGYDREGVTRGGGLARQLDRTLVLQDLQAAIDLAASAGAGGVGVVGYCFGGTLAWLVAGHGTSVRCVSSYYGGHVVHVLDHTPRVPIILHFGDRDRMIPASDVDKVRAAHPSVPIHVYAADHGFNCTERASHDPEAARLALERTLALFDQHLSPA